MVESKKNETLALPAVSLSQLLDTIMPVSPELDCDITSLCIDSRDVKPGALFIAYPGHSEDGRLFIAQALALGASVILYDQSTPLPDEALAAIQETEHHAVCLGIPFQANFIGQIAAQFYQNPTMQLDAVAITGTNGKTSVSYLIASALHFLDKSYGLIGTLGDGFVENLSPGSMTTPNALAIQEKAAQFLASGAEGLVLEASSHGIVQERLSGCYIDTAVFTNFRSDHLDFHGSKDDYFEAKARLFSRPEIQHAILPNDDIGDALAARCQSGVRIVRYQMMATAQVLSDTLVGSNLVMRHDGLQFDVTSPWGEGHLHSRLWGAFQADNLLAALAVLLVRGIAFDDALQTLSRIVSIPGRMEVFGGKGQPCVVIDYAHNGDGLNQALLTLKELSPRKLWCVFGCGGGRDPMRRSEMGKIAELHSDQLIITNDNPRNEAPEKITDEILAGLVCPWAAVVEHDRNRAIAHAITHADADDIILIAGKGHETTMEVNDQVIPHSDIDQVRSLLERGGV